MRISKPVEPEPVIEEKPEKMYENKQMANCPDCNILTSQHTLKYIHKKREYCKGAFQEEVKEEVKKETVKQPPKQKPTKTITTITGDIEIHILKTTLIP